MAGGRMNGASLGVALSAALVGSAIVVGISGSPLALAPSRTPLSAPQSTHFQTAATLTTQSQWDQSSAGNEPAGQVCGGNYVAVRATVGGAPSAKEAVRRFVTAHRPTWPRDGWVEDQALGYMPDIGLELHHPKFGPFVDAQKASDGTWTVTDTYCEPRPAP